MSSNYEKVLILFKKWPVDLTKKSRDYGSHLREVYKNVRSTAGIFHSNEKEISKKLDSLTRLAENKYSNKYSHNFKFGATGLPLSTLNQALSDKFIDNYNKMRIRF